MAVSYQPQNNKTRPWGVSWSVYVGPRPYRIKKRLFLGYYATETEARTAEAEWKVKNGRPMTREQIARRRIA